MTLIAPPRSIIKPPQWNFDPALVDPQWAWFWRAEAVTHLFDEGGGGTAYSARREFDLARTGGVTWESRERGRGLTLHQTLNERMEGVVGQLHGLTDNNNNFAVSWYGRWEGTANQTIFAIAGDSGVAGVVAMYKNGTSSLQVDIPWVAAIGAATVTFTTGQDELWTLTRFGGDQWRLYRDGVVEWSLTNSDSFNATNNHRLMIGGWPGVLSTALPRFVYWNSVHHQGMSLEQHTQLARDPFGPFRAARRRRVFVSAGGGITLTVADATHGHTADNLALVQAHLLAMQDAAHAHSAENLALIQASILAINAALHGHASDNINLTVTGSTLSVFDSLHDHTADTIFLQIPGVGGVVIQHNKLGIMISIGI